MLPKSRAASALKAPATSPLPCMKCAMSCMAFPAVGACGSATPGAICCRRSAGIAASCMVAAKFSASEARNWVACASESSRAALTPLAFWNAPIWV